MKKKLLMALAIGVIFGVLGYGLCIPQKEATQMPAIYINLNDGEEFYEKEYCDTEIIIDYAQLSGVYEADAQIRYRGNGTLKYSKKAFKIKLDEKADLLLGASTVSDGAERDWILLAEYYDRSNLRNYYTFCVASMLDGLDYVTDCMFVEVYLNDEYQGIYLMCESIEVAESRVDIDDSASAERGFLIELVRESKANQDYTVMVYHEDTLLYYDVLSDMELEDNEKTTEEYYRIFDIVQNVEDALASGDQEEIAAAIDLDSCVDMYLLHEFLLNIDVGWGSFYFYCEAGEDILYFSPPWDFDHAAGMDRRLLSGSYKGIYVGDSESDMMQCNLWYQRLMELEWFQDLVKERWNEVSDVFLLALEETEQIGELYSEKFQENHEMWHAQGSYSDSDWAYKGETYQDDAAYLFDWIENRYIWYDAYINDQM